MQSTVKKASVESSVAAPDHTVSSLNNRSILPRGGELLLFWVRVRELMLLDTKILHFGRLRVMKGQPGPRARVTEDVQIWPGPSAFGCACGFWCVLGWPTADRYPLCLGTSQQRAPSTGAQVAATSNTGHYLPHQRGKPPAPEFTCSDRRASYTIGLILSALSNR
jgi:hypothetical protein